MATIIKNPTLVQSNLSPKKPDNHVFVVFNHGCAKFEVDNLSHWGGNRVLQTRGH